MCKQLRSNGESPLNFTHFDCLSADCLTSVKNPSSDHPLKYRCPERYRSGSFAAEPSKTPVSALDQAITYAKYGWTAVVLGTLILQLWPRRNPTPEP